MHYGVFHGKFADQREERILILGESHRITKEKDRETDKEPGKRASYPTSAVVVSHLDPENKEKHSFFTKIAATFGFAEPEQADFWYQVYFGNYIDVLCDVRTSYAKNKIKEENNREKYNKQLFDFICDHKIKKLFCFSVLTYENLPKLEGNEKAIKTPIGYRGNRQVYLRRCTYKKGVAHPGLPVLKQDLTVYGISHPSACGGYSLELFEETLKGQF